MTGNCQNCNKEWRERYIMAERRFDKSLRIAILVTLISVIIALSCIMFTIYYALQLQKFIESFEYVEEVEVHQDDTGTNIAVIGDKNEVKP